MKNLSRFTCACAILISFLCNNALLQTKTDTLVENRAKAMTLVDENRYLDAYPLLEKIAPSLPNDVEVWVWTAYGIALGSRSVTLSNPVERKTERKRAYDALTKAKELGTRSVMALAILDQLPPDGGAEDMITAVNPEVEKGLREGENFFGRAEYQRALEAYQRAYKADPKKLRSSVVHRRLLLRPEKIAESEPWFQKAISLDPDRELAYRFWGDALLYQGKLKEAREKFIDAFIADPYARHSWENINKLTEKAGRQLSVKGVLPPGTKPFEDIKLETASLTADDGTYHWRKYAAVREAWKKDLFKKSFPNQAYRHSLLEESAALRAVAESASNASTAGKLKSPHHSIKNLLERHNAGLIEPYVLIMLSDEGVAEDYVEYRKANREKLRRFLSEFVFVFS